ncbi:serine/threonine-protein phosphatase [Streptomyces bomunensis]|uniref:protein-serine/threonine phosphatase n=2 Tax=Streptomyces montanisoli TaxID=2798581 RepID=A0A940MDV1_9ACTN|nr:serine/threonine-protein phosphatase [Streptomyces montanisoli]
MHTFREPSSGPPMISESARVAQTALSANGMGVFLWDVNTGVMRYNDAGLAVMGISPHEWDGRLETLGERMVDTELPAVQARVERALKEGTSFSLYFRVRLPGNSLRWTHTQGRVVSDGQGRPARVIGIIRDASQELLAVDQTEQVRKARSDRRRQAAIAGSLNEALAGAVTVSDVAQAVTSTELLGQLGAATIALGLLDNGRVIPAGSNNLPDNWVRNVHLGRYDEPLPLSDVIRTGQPVFLTSREQYAEKYPGLRPLLDQIPDATAAAYLPLIAHGSPIGAIGLSYNGKAQFTPDEQTVLTAVSTTIAQSLQRALLYDGEHELASGLQAAMLPQTMPHVPGVDLTVRYRPAHPPGDVGGDWYDAILLPGGQIIAVVGDVEGHDVTAAAVMGQLRIALHAYADEGHPPATIMARTSAFLAESDTDRLATCILVHLDPATGRMVTVRAGHTPPALRRPNHGTTWIDTPGGLPLGLTEPNGFHTYPETEITLEPEATLLLCTDGLLETRTADVDTDTKLLNTLRTGPPNPDPLADHLINTMATCTGEEDDVALLLLRRTTHKPSATRTPRITVPISRTNPDSLHTARHTLRTALHQWSLDPLRDTAELLACELTTNALLHTHGTVTLTATPVETDRRTLRLTVTDTSSAPPRRRSASEQSTSGRGLVLVEELATAWGITARGNGKAVWCDIPLVRD